MQATEAAIRSVVQEVLAQLNTSNGARKNGSAVRTGDWGVHDCVDQAVDAATDGFHALGRASMDTRRQIVEIVKSMCEQRATEWGKAELGETRIGRLDHKIGKLEAIRQVPGVEFLRTDAVSGDNGLTVTEYAPFGVVGAITPVTHSLPTVAGNVVNMIAAGNTVLFNPHPSGARIACEGVKEFNKAIHAATGLENLINIVRDPTLESAEAIFNHRGIPLLCVTGGPGVARAALSAKKRAIVAGPGNPPVVVDGSADLDVAAKGIVDGGAFDNNLLCIGEKEVFAVESIFDDLLSAMGRHGGFQLNAQQTDKLTSLAFSPPKEPGGHAVLNRDLIGKDATVLADMIGVAVPENTQLLFGETDTNNPFVPEEQMMPFVPFVRARNASDAIEMAKHFEHDFRHTAIIHSRNVRHMTEMGRYLNTTLFIKNGPCMAGLGLGGEGFLSFSIATPTGEGVTSPLTFTRQRRCTMVDDLRIV